MNLQLVEVYIPNQEYPHVSQRLVQFSMEGTWKEFEAEGDRKLVKLIVASEDVEDVLNFLESMSKSVEGFETILLPIHTYFSHDTIEKSEQEKEEEEEEEQGKFIRASRQELMHTIEKQSHLTLNYVFLILFSSIVATAGYMKDDTAVVIGAMAIAPLIGPAISLAFATVLGDLTHMGKSGLTLGVGLLFVVIISSLFGFLFIDGIYSKEYSARTTVTLADFFIALAAGAAGAMSILNRLSSNLVGVMVAVALLPPMITFGMSIGQGLWHDTFGSFMLIVTNITCIIISAITIFFLSGIRPVKWRDETMVNTSRSVSIVLITFILLILLTVIILGI